LEATIKNHGEFVGEFVVAAAVGCENLLALS